MFFQLPLSEDDCGGDNFFLLKALSTSSNNSEDDDDTGDKEDITRSMVAHFGNPLVIKRSNYFCSTLMFSTRRLDEMLSDDDTRTLFSSTQSVPVRLSSCCRDRSVCLSSSNFLLCSHLLMVPMASQPLMASLAYVHNTHSHAQTQTHAIADAHTHTNTHTQRLPFLPGLYSLCLGFTFLVHILIIGIKIKSTPYKGNQIHPDSCFSLSSPECPTGSAHIY